MVPSVGAKHRMLLLSARACLRMWAWVTGKHWGSVIIFPRLRGVRACLLSPHLPPGPPVRSGYPRVVLQDEHQPMHVQPALPGVGIHGQHWLPVGRKLGVGGVGPTVLK